jgi:hypothetical protein
MTSGIPKFVTAPFSDEQLVQIRQELEDGGFPSGHKYAVIQGLVEAHLLANKKVRLLTAWNDNYEKTLNKLREALGDDEEDSDD